MRACRPHRRYISAVADGELELVPVQSLGHIQTCPACGTEVREHAWLSVQVRAVGRRASPRVAAVAPGRPAPWRARQSWGAVLAVVLVAVGVGVWRLGAVAPPSPVAAAVAAGRLAPQLRSHDVATIERWCRRVAGRDVPVVRVAGLVLVGARMDRAPGVSVATVSYVTRGGVVAVSWLTSDHRAPRSPTTREWISAGRRALVVASGRLVAIVSGRAAPGVLRATAATIAAVIGRA